MTEHEAIKWLKAIQATQNQSIHKSSLSDRKEALHMAISTLEKQIPKNPNKYIDHAGIERDGCPNCYEIKERNEILYAGQKYCSVCGQAIDWSE